MIRIKILPSKQSRNMTTAVKIENDASAASNLKVKTPIWQFKCFQEWVKTVLFNELIRSGDK